MNFSIRLRNIIYVGTFLVFVWFFFTQKALFTPFLIAMIFAYVFTPLIDLFNHKLKINRTVSIVIVYIILLVSTISIITFLTRSIILESESIERSFTVFSSTIKNGISGGPEFLNFLFSDYLTNFSKSQIPNIISLPFFTKAFSGIVNLFILLFTAFFFLKDGRKFADKLVSVFPSEYKVDASELMRKINVVLSAYLRGQIILIIAMMIMLYGTFLFLGVKNALTLSLASALFEIVPIIGPIVAAVIGTFVIVISGGISTFYFPIFQVVILILVVYAVTRYIQDYAISPFVIGKATHLHPVVILFSVVAGEHLYGILGVILAVPVAASIKIIYTFIFERIHKK